MTRVLCIGMGGVGVIASYALQLNPDADVTAVVRSQYDQVTTSGYTISSVDYGGRRKNGDPNEAENSIKGYRPKTVVRTLDDLADAPPFDYIVVATKVVPSAHNVWDDVESHPHLLLPDRGTSIVLIQNGIDIESYWKNIASKVNLISGVSYISSINNNGSVTHYGNDNVVFGLFDFEQLGDPNAQKLLHKFVDLYSNSYNTVAVDHNTRFTRWKKLLWNGSFNVVCCLTRQDVGQIFRAKLEKQLILPVMHQIQHAANDDLKRFDYGEYNRLIADEDVEWLLEMTKNTDAMDNYKPSMLVDVLEGRPIESEIILGNVIKIHNANNFGSQNDPEKSQKIALLTNLYNLLLLQQFK